MAATETTRDLTVGSVGGADGLDVAPGVLGRAVVVLFVDVGLDTVGGEGAGWRDQEGPGENGGRDEGTAERAETAKHRERPKVNFGECETVLRIDRFVALLDLGTSGSRSVLQCPHWSVAS